MALLILPPVVVRMSQLRSGGVDPDAEASIVEEEDDEDAALFAESAAE